MPLKDCKQHIIQENNWYCSVIDQIEGQRVNSRISNSSSSSLDFCTLLSISGECKLAIPLWSFDLLSSSDHFSSYWIIVQIVREYWQFSKIENAHILISFQSWRRVFLLVCGDYVVWWSKDIILREVTTWS